MTGRRFDFCAPSAVATPRELLNFQPRVVLACPPRWSKRVRTAVVSGARAGGIHPFNCVCCSSFCFTLTFSSIMWHLLDAVPSEGAQSNDQTTLTTILSPPPPTHPNSKQAAGLGVISQTIFRLSCPVPRRHRDGDGEASSRNSSSSSRNSSRGGSNRRLRSSSSSLILLDATTPSHRHTAGTAPPGLFRRGLLPPAPVARGRARAGGSSRSSSIDGPLAPAAGPPATTDV